MMTISSKLIRSFFTKWKDMEHCPRRVYHEVVLREKEPDPYKDYFLKRCTGVDADLPRKRNGEKTINHIRIDTRVMEFHRQCRLRMVGENVFNTNVSIRMPLRDGFMLEERVSIYPTFILEESPTIAFISIKLTSSTARRFGDDPWGEPQWLDLTEMMSIHTILRHIDRDATNTEGLPIQVVDNALQGLTRGFWWVFGYLNDGFLPIEVPYTDLRSSEFKESLRRTMNLCSDYEASGWPTSPGAHCVGCNVRCDARNEIIKL